MGVTNCRFTENIFEKIEDDLMDSLLENFKCDASHVGEIIDDIMELFSVSQVAKIVKYNKRKDEKFLAKANLAFQRKISQLVIFFFILCVEIFFCVELSNFPSPLFIF